MQFCQVPVKIIIHYGHSIPFEIYLKLSDNKMVKISNKEENVKDTVAKYLSKGVKEIFANQKDYAFFIEELNRDLTTKFFNAETSQEQRMEMMQMGLELLRASFQRVGPKENSFKLATNISLRTSEIIKGYKDIDELYTKYKTICQNEYIKSMFISACVVAMIETFDWKTDQSKERAVQSILLRDIMLTNEDQIELKEKISTPEKLSERIYNHPILTAKLLAPDKSNKFFSQDVITVIEQHHERPDGKGFPRKTDHQHIILLTAIQIVADAYVEGMINVHFSPEKKADVLEVLREEFKKGNYRKAFDALEEILKK